MSELENKIFEHFTLYEQYNFSTDLTIKKLEMVAIENVKQNGYIIIKTRTIGYVVAVTV